MGQRFGAVSFVQIMAPELNDRMLADFLDMEGSSITCELMEHFGCTKTLVSEPAFVKRRGRLLPEALETIFRLFVENTRPSNRYKGFQFLAVDGSDLHTPTNPDDTASFISGSGGQKPYNLQHLNALYDLCSHIYTDAIVQGRRQYDELRALCDMVDRANAVYPAIIIADRGYESYNVFPRVKIYYRALALSCQKAGLYPSGDICPPDHV